MKPWSWIIFFLFLAPAGCGSGGRTVSETTPATDPAPAPAKDTPEKKPELVFPQQTNCVLAGGSLRLMVPKPDDYTLEQADERCSLYKGDDPSQSPLMINVQAISTGDAGHEQLLNEEPDGALRFVLESGVLGPEVRQLGEDILDVLGEQVPCYHLLGKPPGFTQNREMTVFRVHYDGYNIFCAAVYAPDHACSRQLFLDILAQSQLAP